MFVPAVVFAALASASARANVSDTASRWEKNRPYPQAEKGMKAARVLTLTLSRMNTPQSGTVDWPNAECGCGSASLGGTLGNKTLGGRLGLTIMSLITSPLRYKP